MITSLEQELLSVANSATMSAHQLIGVELDDTQTQMLRRHYKLVLERRVASETKHES